MLDEADVISLHAAVTPETQGMIAAPQFDAMKDGVIFLNTAREQLHDRDALVASLQSGKVGAPASTTSSASASIPIIR